MSQESLSVCIIIPNYNHSQWLDDAIKSALNQTYNNTEIIIIDDGSNDKQKVRSIVRNNLTSKIKFIDVPVNQGKWFVLNEAIKNTSCHLITTLDADDVCPADRIQRQVSVLTQVPNVAHVLTGFYHCWSDKDVKDNVVKLQTGDLKVIHPVDVRKNVMAGYCTQGINHYFTGDVETAGASAMFYRDLWQIGFRFNPPKMGLRTLLSEDSDFNFRLTSALGQTAILNEQLYCYRRNTSTNKEMF
jgi:glycosyltransferase involved in cell wall biosynthesis